MSNINVNLLNEISTEYHCSAYGYEKSDIEEFLMEKDFALRQNRATEIIKKILTQHGKQRLSNHVLRLAKVEEGNKYIQPEYRDHVVHALLSFLTGVYINENFFPASNLYKVDPFQWKLAGLLHDVAYPVQIAENVTKIYSDEINTIKRSLGNSAPDIFFKVIPVNIHELKNDKDSFDLIQEQLNKWDIQINVRDEFDKIIESGEICHGMIGALGILYVIDLLYQSNNPSRKHEPKFSDDPRIDWNQEYFEQDIVPACAAIFIHNLAGSCFKKTKIDPIKAPLAFLLKLSDVLQEWERPSLRNLNGYDAENFDINIVEGKLFLSANIPGETKEKMEREIVSCLNTKNIRIK